MQTVLTAPRYGAPRRRIKAVRALEHAYANVPLYRRKFDEAGVRPELFIDSGPGAEGTGVVRL